MAKLWAAILFEFQWHIENASSKLRLGYGFISTSPLTNNNRLFTYFERSNLIQAEKRIISFKFLITRKYWGKMALWKSSKSVFMFTLRCWYLIFLFVFLLKQSILLLSAPTAPWYCIRLTGIFKQIRKPTFVSITNVIHCRNKYPRWTRKYAWKAVKM